MKRRTFLKNTLAASVALTLPFSCRTATPSQLATQITDWSAVDLSNAIRTKRVSCVEVMTAYLKHIHPVSYTHLTLPTKRIV